MVTQLTARIHCIHTSWQAALQPLPQTGIVLILGMCIHVSFWFVQKVHSWLDSCSEQRTAFHQCACTTGVEANTTAILCTKLLGLLGDGPLC